MKLSESQNKMVEKLHQRQNQFRRWRLILLISHSLLLIFWFVALLWICLAGNHFSNQGEINTKLILLSSSLPIVLFFGGFSSYQLGLTLRNWNGDPTTELLLKVVDELNKESK
jgi:hypothetical protein